MSKVIRRYSIEFKDFGPARLAGNEANSRSPDTEKLRQKVDAGFIGATVGRRRSNVQSVTISHQSSEARSSRIRVYPNRKPCL
jgi:hypothetical protein